VHSFFLICTNVRNSWRYFSHHFFSNSASPFILIRVCRISLSLRQFLTVRCFLSFQNKSAQFLPSSLSTSLPFCSSAVLPSALLKTEEISGTDRVQSYIWQANSSFITKYPINTLICQETLTRIQLTTPCSLTNWFLLWQEIFS